MVDGKAKSNRISRISKSVLLHVVIYIVALATVAPFIWMILTSVKSLNDIFVYPPKWWPSEFHFENYRRVFEAAPFGRFYE